MDLFGSTKNTQIGTTLIMPHQREAFEKLVEIGRVCFSGKNKNLPVKVRANTFITGPSGSGKSYLAKAVADALKVPCLVLSVSEWILLGCSKRGAEVTWITIFKFLVKAGMHPGCVIFLDELDKLCPGKTSWETYQLTELYSLLDYRIPESLRDSDGDPMRVGEMRVAREMLAGKTFIIAAGAFQGIWDRRARPSVGFLGEPAPVESPGLGDLAGSIGRELANRFRAETITLPPLQEDGYLRMIDAAAAKMPSGLREYFLDLGMERVGVAVREQQGPRFLEEVMLDALMAEERAKHGKTRSPASPMGPDMESPWKTP